MHRYDGGKNIKNPKKKKAVTEVRLFLMPSILK